MSRYSDLVLADSPVGHWRLNETSGTSFADQASIGALTSSGTVTLAQAGALLDDSDTSLGFDGASAYLTTPTINSVVKAFECWFKPAATISPNATPNPVLLSPLSGTYPFLQLGSATGASTAESITLYANSTSSRIVTGLTFVAGAWVHLVVQQAPDGTWEFWVNGEKQTAVTAEGTPTASLQSGVGYRIGAWFSGGNYFGGSLDEVAVYPLALPGDRIIAHYTEGRKRGMRDEILALSPSIYWPGEPQAVDLGSARMNGTFTGTVNRSGLLADTDGYQFTNHASTGQAVSYVENASSGPQNISTDSFCVHCLLQSQNNGSNYVQVFIKDGSSSGSGEPILYIDITNGYMRGICRSSDINSGVSVLDGLPHHIVFLRRGTALELWKDGVLVNSATNSSDLTAGGNTAYRWGAGNGTYAGFKGTISHMAWWKGFAPTAAQVRRLYAARLIPPLRSRLFA